MILVRYDDTGAITHLRHNISDDYEAGDGEALVGEGVAIEGKKINLDSGDLVDDPDYEPPETIAGRVAALEDAAGVGEDPPKRGIAHRLDAIADKQDELEQRIADLE